MEIKKVVMTNGKEYLVLGYENAPLEFSEDGQGFTRLLDVENGWIDINENFISEIINGWNKINKNIIIKPEVRKLIITQHGEGIFSELGIR
jgi:hypothetical protein